MKKIPTQDIIDQYKEDLAAALRMKDDMEQLNEFNRDRKSVV